MAIVWRISLRPLSFSKMQSQCWAANWFSASQQIPRISWNAKVHYHIHNSPLPVPILSQLDPLHTPTFHFLKIHLNIFLTSTPGSPKLSISFMVPLQNTVHASTLPHTRYMSRPSHSARYYHPNNTGWVVQIWNKCTITGIVISFEQELQTNALLMLLHKGKKNT